VSRIKGADGKLVRTPEQLPPGLELLPLVSHRDEIVAPYSPRCMAVKIVEDDLESWARFAILRRQTRRRSAPREDPPETAPSVRPARPVASSFVPMSREAKLAVAEALVRFDEKEHGPLQRGIGRLTDDDEADQLVHEDPLAFLLAVLFDQQIAYGRAWRAPLELRRRLGHLDPVQMLAEPSALFEAVQQPPALHRYVNKIPGWILDACRRIEAEFDGHAANIWSNAPTARELEARLLAFVGISQKKAAMTVMLLWRHLGVDVREMDGCDVAVDVHVRRVFLRSGLVERDDPRMIVKAARELWPRLPGALDPPAWAVGMRWCRPQMPRCPECIVNEACPMLLDRGYGISG
jgi:uncharacterized HhH-GPD family protein